MATPRWPDVPRRLEQGLEIITVRVRQPRRFLSLLGPPPPIEIRRFSDEKLQASIDAVLATMPSDARAVEVDVAGDQNGVHGVVVYKTPGGWSILGGAWLDKSRQWGWQVAARKVW